MAKIKPWIAVLGALSLGGCASAPIATGTLIGAASGAALGAGTGVLISDPNLLGSPETEESGNIGLKTGPAIGAGALIGAVFGGLLGAMLAYDEKDANEEPPPPEAQARRVQPSAF